MRRNRRRICTAALVALLVLGSVQTGFASWNTSVSGGGSVSVHLAESSEAQVEVVDAWMVLSDNGTLVGSTEAAEAAEVESDEPETDESEVVESETDESETSELKTADLKTDEPETGEAGTNESEFEKTESEAEKETGAENETANEEGYKGKSETSDDAESGIGSGTSEESEESASEEGESGDVGNGSSGSAAEDSEEDETVISGESVSGNGSETEEESESGTAAETESASGNEAETAEKNRTENTAETAEETEAGTDSETTADGEEMTTAVQAGSGSAGIRSQSLVWTTVSQTNSQISLLSYELTQENGITWEGTDVSFPDVTLSLPGAWVEYFIKVKNTGSADAVLEEYDIPTGSDVLKSYIPAGYEAEKGEVLKAGETRTFAFVVWIPSSYTGTVSETVDLDYTLTYSGSNGGAEEVEEAPKAGYRIDRGL